MNDVFGNEKVDSLKFLRFLYTNRKTLIITAIVAFGASIGLTSLTPKTFYSVGIIFPTNTNSSQDILDNPQFGYDLDADRLMQVLESETIMDSIISKYNLIEYYQLDTTQLDWEYYLDKRFVQDITFFRSRYMSIVITAKMKDPVLAANVINSIIDMVDDVREDIFKKNTYAAFRDVENEYRSKEAEVNLLLDSIYTLREQNADVSVQQMGKSLKQLQQTIDAKRKQLQTLQKSNGFYDLDAEMDKVKFQLREAEAIKVKQEGRLKVLEASYGNNDSIIITVKADIEGAKASLKYWGNELTQLQNVNKPYHVLKDNLDSDLKSLYTLRVDYEEALNRYEPAVESFRVRHLEELLVQERGRLSELKSNYERAKNKYNRALPSIYVIDRAKPNFKKASPSYSFNAILGTLVSLFMAMVILLFRSRLRELKQQMQEK